MVASKSWMRLRRWRYAGCNGENSRRPEVYTPIRVMMPVQILMSVTILTLALVKGLSIYVGVIKERQSNQRPVLRLHTSRAAQATLFCDAFLFSAFAALIGLTLPVSHSVNFRCVWKKIPFAEVSSCSQSTLEFELDKAQALQPVARDLQREHAHKLLSY